MRVTILLTEQLSLFELACAVELFALPRPEFDTWYHCEIVSLTEPFYSSAAGVTLECKLLTELPASDLLVIPSFPVAATNVDDNVKRQVLQHYQNGGRIISFCSGSFLLAHLGILNQRDAVTHWRYSKMFHQQFPHISLKEDVLYSYDGKIGCSAGSAAGIDLGIEVIRQDFGYAKANSVARRLVLPAHRSGSQAQYVEKALGKNKSSLSSTLDWAQTNLTSELKIDDMAKKANMTRRTFDRQFKKHYQITPQNWLIQRKIELAKTLLETTEISIEQVAIKAGFETAITLRHNFKKFVSISPTAYRNTFARGELLN